MSQRPQRRQQRERRQPRSNYRKERSERTSEEYEIRIRAGQSGTSYINRAANLLLRDQQQLEEGQTAQPALDFVVLKAAGPAINTALNVSGVIRRKIGGLHQINRIFNETVVDKYIPKETGLDTIEQERVLSVFEILLTRNPSEEQKAEPGYLGTLAEDQVTETKLDQIVLQPRRETRRDDRRREDRRDNNNNRRDNRRRDDRRSGDREERRGGDRRRDDRRRDDREDRRGGDRRDNRQSNRSNQQQRKRSGEQKTRGGARN